LRVASRAAPTFTSAAHTSSTLTPAVQQPAQTPAVCTDGPLSRNIACRACHPIASAPHSAATELHTPIGRHELQLSVAGRAVQPAGPGRKSHQEQRGGHRGRFLLLAPHVYTRGGSSLQHISPGVGQGHAGRASTRLKTAISDARAGLLTLNSQTWNFTLHTSALAATDPG
jgi:hypothetical protein